MFTILLVMISPFNCFELSTIHCDCTDLVVWGQNLYSNVGNPRFSPLVSSMISLPPHIQGIIVGEVLSDAGLGFAHSRAKNCRLGFQQSLSHFGYFWSVFTKLAPYCKSIQNIYARKTKGTTCYALGLYTRALPCFTEFYHLFYVDGVKVVPFPRGGTPIPPAGGEGTPLAGVDILNLLTPIALAQWIQGDGMREGYGVILCTDSFTTPDVVRLMNVLIIRYNLECNLRMHIGKPRIYIRSASMPLLRFIVVGHMDPSMLYKLGI